MNHCIIRTTNVLLDKCIKICLGSFFTRRNVIVIKQIQIALHCTKNYTFYEPDRSCQMLKNVISLWSAIGFSNFFKIVSCQIIGGGE